MNMMGLGRNGDVLKWLQMVLQQSQSPRGQVPTATPYGGGMGGAEEMPQNEEPPAQEEPDPAAAPMGGMGGMMPAPMQAANPFDVMKRRRRV